MNPKNRTGPLLMGAGCLAPFALAAISLMMMFAAVDGRGGSGLIAVYGFVGGAVIGIPMFIVGAVMLSKATTTTTPDSEDPPPVS